MSARFIFSTLLVLLCNFCFASNDWKKAENDIKRLSVSEFPHLPPEVKRKIEAKGCNIPQAFVSNKPHNVVKGNFASKNSQDWALLCSKEGKSSVFVIWGDKEVCPSEIEMNEDKNFLQTIDEKNIGYSRVLAASGKEDILNYQKNHGGTLPTKLDHQGISDAFAEKASKIHFCEKGKWLALTGSD
jgi:hypothetical protein